MRNFLAMIGCATVLVAVAIGAWVFRDELRGAYESFQEQRAARAAGAEGDVVASTGVVSDDALARAEVKEAALRDPRGPAYVELTPDEFASLVGSRLASEVGSALDSVTVGLTRDRVAISGLLRLDALGRDLLGPIADLLGSRQPLRAGGSVAVRQPGVMAWSVDEFVIRDFGFPSSAIPRLVDGLGGDTTGAFLIGIPDAVGDIRVRADGIVFYREVP
jgi:hypothetical protein